MRFKNNKGITLVALVITIIILLILAGISIMSLTNTGIFGKAQDAKTKSAEAETNQKATLDEYETELNKYGAGTNGGNQGQGGGTSTGGNQGQGGGTSTIGDSTVNQVISTSENKEIADAKGNKIVIPAGFKIVKTGTNYENTANNEITVDKGIVVEDATGTATNGSQFVWIPVGTITKADGSTTSVNLNRYTLDGTPTKQNDEVINCYGSDFQELESSEKRNIVAKNIANFKSSVTTNGGFYIGRYEARTATPRSSEDDTLTQITENGEESVYNYVTQIQAAQLARGMYDDTHPFTSDLVNSYAWDTATLFLQNCGKENYSRKASVNDSLASKGTNASDYTGTRDNPCNVYDMASNAYEWTTETSSFYSAPCVGRGGSCFNSGFFTSFRYSGYTSSSFDYTGFRPLLYL